MEHRIEETPAMNVHGEGRVERRDQDVVHLPHTRFPQISQDREALDLTRILAALRRQKLIVALPLIGTLALAIAYLSAAPTEYTSTAELIVELQKPRILRNEAVVPGLDAGPYMIGPVMDSQVELLQSQRIAERVIKRLDLAAGPPPTPGPIASLLGFFRTAAPAEADSPATPAAGESEAGEGEETAAEDAIPTSLYKQFEESLSVRRKGLSLLILVSATDEDPNQAARIANGVVQEYLDDQRETQLASARDATSALNERVEELRQQVLAREQAIQSFRQRHDLAAVGDVPIADRQLSDMLVRLNEAETDAAARRAELRQVEMIAEEGGDASFIGRVLDSQVVRDLKRQESEIVRRIGSLKREFGESDYRIEIAQSELDDIRGAIAEETARLVENARYESDVAQTRVRILEENFNAMKQLVYERSGQQIRLSDLEREAKASRDLYESLLARLKETRVAESLLYPDIRMVEPASPPLEPSSPNTKLTLLVALVGGLGIGLTGAILRDHLAGSLWTPEDVEQRLNLKLLAPLPRIRAGWGSSRHDHLLRDPASNYGQSIFLLAHTLLDLRHTAEDAVVAMASPRKGDGKTTTTANLGYYLAQTGRRVLLVDCDLREPTLSRLMASGRERSIADVLDATCKPEDAIVAASGLETLAILPAPARIDGQRASELLGSDRLRKVLSQLRDRYDLIIVDGGSLLQDVEARLLLDAVDSAILVLRAGKSSLADVERSTHLASILSLKMSGVVLNGADLSG
ncbi:GumC family protein [Afifella pfennigii]|uniref:GumC family protein n=1 Tax=Afifella pfennigii TaxID=209897 RepID=UPI0004799C11|nr:polysaccharide biosynthesis tyrosine autokinase [Afifella pfennigii]